MIILTMIMVIIIDDHFHDAVIIIDYDDDHGYHDS